MGDAIVWELGWGGGKEVGGIIIGRECEIRGQKFRRERGEQVLRR